MLSLPFLFLQAPVLSVPGDHKYNQPKDNITSKFTEQKMKYTLCVIYSWTASFFFDINCIQSFFLFVYGWYTVNVLWV